MFAKYAGIYDVIFAFGLELEMKLINSDPKSDITYPSILFSVYFLVTISGLVLQSNIGLFDYPDFFLYMIPVFSELLISCHFKNSKLQIVQLNPFKRLLERVLSFFATATRQTTNIRMRSADFLLAQLFCYQGNFVLD